MGREQGSPSLWYQQQQEVEEDEEGMKGSTHAWRLYPMSLFGLWDILTGKQVCKKG